jgi:hypothetical protein
MHARTLFIYSIDRPFATRRFACASRMAAASHPTAAQLLVQRLCDTAKRLSGPDQPLAFYGVPGDYSFGLCDAIEACADAVWHGCANELEAGYAADGMLLRPLTAAAR